MNNDAKLTKSEQPNSLNHSPINKKHINKAIKKINLQF